MSRFKAAPGIVATAKAVSTAEAEARSGTIRAARTSEAKAGVAESPVLFANANSRCP